MCVHSSWVLFNEDIRTQTTERIGRSIYNTTTNTIEGFTADEQLYNHYNFDPVVFAWNMDPMTLRGINPYEVFGNNPVLYSDLQGDLKYPSGSNHATDFPYLTTYLSENFENDVVTNKRVVFALKEFGLYIDENAIRNDVRWGNGPNIKYVENPGNMDNDYGEDNA